MKRVRGASKLEFALVVAIFGVLATALLVRVNAIEQEAERTEVDLTVRNIRVGIQLAIGERIIRGEEGRLDEVAEASPIQFLGQTPRGFVEGGQASGPGEWAYDPARRELSYRPRLPGAFADAEILRWGYLARRDAGGRATGVTLVRMN